MKRSKSIKLVVMASTTMTLAGCSQEPNVEGRVYKSEAECVSDTYLEDGSCSDVFEIGQKVHQESGPRYESMSLCLDQHGNQCTETPAPGYSYFTPLAVGYFASKLAGNALDQSSVRPIYSERGSSRYFTSGGYYVGSYGGGSWRTYDDAVKTPPKPAKVQTRTSVASRGGFGSRSSGGFRGG